MVSTIIDNSTLTAVQRLTGDISVPKAHDVEGDVSAFESFLSALIFCDELFFVDDYKDAYRDSRRQKFSYIRPLTATGSVYSRLDCTAKKLTAESVLSSTGAFITPNEIGNFLEQIRLYLTAAWTMQSSEWFLHLRVLSNGGDSDRFKYSKLTSAIYHQVLELGGNLDGRNKLTAASGRALKEILAEDSDHHVSEQLTQFVASLNWLSQRTVFYYLYSNQLEASATLHPIRHSFLIQYLSTKGLSVGPSLPQNLIRFFSSESSVAISRLNQAVDDVSVEFNLPWLAGWLVGESGTPSEAIEKAIDMRGNGAIERVRSRISEIDHLQRQPDGLRYKREIVRLKEGVQSELAKLVSGQEGLRGLSRSVKFSLELSGPSLSGEGAISTLLHPLLSKNRHVTGFVRNIARDILSYQDLGRVRSRLRSQVRRDGEKYMPVLAIEDPKYRLAKPYWKRPL